MGKIEKTQLLLIRYASETHVFHLGSSQLCLLGHASTQSRETRVRSIYEGKTNEGNNVQNKQQNRQ